MKNILDYKLIILDKEANIVTYDKMFGMHQDCLDDFSRKYNYEYSNEVYLVSKGNVIFKNAGLNILVAYLPDSLSTEQLYQLDYIQNWLGDVTMFEAYKYIDNNKQWFQCMDNVSDYFSENIIQSYYSTKKKR